MRVITGSARGRRLKELESRETRPTTDKVKEGLFSAIQFDIEGRRVLDLFAGTGQLGIEALSRGAAHATFVDCRKEAVTLIRENLETTKLSDNATVICGDSISYLRSCRDKFDLLFLDPPYADTLLENSLTIATTFDILRPHGIIIAESPEEKILPLLPEPYGIYREYRYGKIKLTIFHREEDKE